MSEDRVLVSIEDQIATVRLNRTDKCNALDMAMFYQIDKTIKRLRSDRNLRAIILRGEGADFCTGLDVKSIFSRKLDALKLIWKWNPWSSNLAQRVSAGWRRIPVPVIAVLHGRCWGGGLQIAFGCDFRIATPDTDLSVMEARWGLIPDMAGTLAMRETMPVDIAMEISMSGEQFSAQKALDWRLITKICDDPMQEAMTMAKKFRDRSPDTVAAVKRLFHKAWHHDDAALLMRETREQWGVILGPNRDIAVKRALGKPKPFKTRRW